MTLMPFASLNAVKVFAGADWKVSIAPLAAREAPSRFDGRAAHYYT
jgi:hypothetical protein